MVIDHGGAVVCSASIEHVVFASPQIGWAEQDPDDWFRAACAAITQAAAAAPGKITAICLTGQMHGAVMLDAAGNVVRPALIWCDQRTGEQSREIESRFGLDEIIRLTCNRPLTNFTLTKLLWVRQHEPENWKRVRHILLPKDYVRFRLSGDYAMDVAEASGTLLLDVARRQWSADVLEKLGIDKMVLPALFESPVVCGKLRSSIASELGLDAGIPIVAGAGDQMAGAVGMGIVRPGMASATIGTSGVVFAATDRPALDAQGRLHTFCHAIPGRWCVMGVTQAAGLSLRWFRDLLQIDSAKNVDPYDLLTAEAAMAPAGCDGILWAPYLMGERTPHLDPGARGALLGLAASHRRAHVLRAVMEGVAFSLKDTLTIFGEMNVPVTKIRLGGGGARSALWRQIQADVYGMPVEILQAEEGAAYGAAILAGAGTGVWNSVDEACDAVIAVRETIEPGPATAVMQAGYQRYRNIYPALKNI